MRAQCVAFWLSCLGCYLLREIIPEVAAGGGLQQLFFVSPRQGFYFNGWLRSRTSTYPQFCAVNNLHAARHPSHVSHDSPGSYCYVIGKLAESEAPVTRTQYVRTSDASVSRVTDLTRDRTWCCGVTREAAWTSVPCFPTPRRS